MFFLFFLEWFELDDQHNTKVYVSNLPLDITETEFVDLMQKCGLLLRDPDTGKMKIKLYSDPINKSLKGDALCTYIKVFIFIIYYFFYYIKFQNTVK